jgi:hypothetical protein
MGKTPGWLIRVGMAAAGVLAYVVTGDGWSAAAVEAPSPCPAGGSASIQVLPFDSGLKYDLGRNEADMMALATRKLPAKMHLRGLTVQHMKSWVEVKANPLKLGTGWCLMPTAIIAHVGFMDMTVYIDRKYLKGSCQRRAIAYHENKHVTINYQEMNAGLPAIDHDLRAAYQSKRFPIYVADPRAGVQYLEEYFFFTLHQGVQQMLDRMETRNVNLDNPQEYASISAMCPVW